MRLIESGHPEQAKKVCSELCQQQPENPDVWSISGTVHGLLNDFIAAGNAYRKAVGITPGNAAFHYNLGICLLHQNKPADAARCFQDAIERQAQYVEAMQGLADALQMQGDNGAAIKLYEQVLQLRPDFALAYCNMAKSLNEKRRWKRAISCYEHAIQIAPDLVEAYCGVGAALLLSFNYKQAVQFLKGAAERFPDHSDLLYKLGLAYGNSGDVASASKCYQRILDNHPEHTAALHGLGHARRIQGRLGAALQHLEKALAIEPDRADVMFEMAGVLREQGRVEEGIEKYREGLEIEPASADAHSNVLFLMNYVDRFQPIDHLDACRAWSAIHGDRGHESTAHQNVFEAGRKLRIGYVSPDFRNHSVAFFLEPILAFRSQDRVETFCYASFRNHPADGTTNRLRRLADNWRDITALTDLQATRLIQDDAIDILVDLAGHTGGNRLGVFAYKPAPVQISYLGYPNSTGMPAMDYRFTDAWADPPNAADQYYVERLARIPDGFLCYAPPATAPAHIDPKEPKPEGITFGSFNNLSKITPAVVGTWAAILAAVPGSRMLLKNGSLRDDGTCGRYHDAFARHGIDKDRVALVAACPTLEEHLALYRKVDIALDTFPYNGTTTTCEALWMGVPVIVLRGSAHAGRVGYSLLTQAGLPELVATSKDDYIRRAVELAGDQALLCDYQQRTHRKMAASSLCDGAGFAQRIEGCYAEIWDKRCSSPIPDPQSTYVARIIQDARIAKPEAYSNHLRRAAARVKQNRYYFQDSLLSPEDMFIASFPRSGSHFLRFILLCAFQYLECGKFPGDLSLMKTLPDIHNHELGRASTERRVIKTHFPYDPRYRKVIHLVRDPGDVLLSYFRFTRTHRKLFFDAEIEEPGLQEFIDIFLRGMVWPCDLRFHSASFAARRADIDYICVRYEQLVLSPEQEVSRLLDFIGISLDADVISRLCKHTSFENMRKLHTSDSAQAGGVFANRSQLFGQGRPGAWNEDLPRAEQTRFNHAFREYREKFGYS